MLAIMEFIAETCRRWPLLSVVVVVDDIQGTAFGEKPFVERVTGEACDFVARGLELRGLPCRPPRSRWSATMLRFFGLSAVGVGCSVALLPGPSEASVPISPAAGAFSTRLG